MATVTFGGSASADLGFLFDAVKFGTVGSSSATKVIFNIDSSTTVTLLGSFTSFDGSGRPTAGTISRIDLVDGSDTAIIKNLAFGVASFNSYVNAQNSDGLLADMFAGNDNIAGTDGVNFLDGYGGNDVFITNSGKVAAVGGDGNDRFYVNAPPITFNNSFQGGLGLDVLQLTHAAEQTTAAGTFVLGILAVFNGIERIRMDSAAGDTLHAVFGINQMAEVTSFQGSAGLDRITMLVPNGGGTFQLKAFSLLNWDSGGGGAATDAYGLVVDSTFTGNYTLKTVNHAGRVYLNGGAGHDKLIGSAGVEGLFGFGGNDLLIGGLGTDRLDGGDGNDTASYASASSGVFVSLWITGQQNTGGDGVDMLVSIENLTGSDHADTLIGNGEANVLNGGKGADTLRGYGGDDTYYVDNTADLVREDANGGTDTVRSSASAFTLQANVENLLLLGSAGIRGAGNADANVITGNNGSNILNGKDGADTLSGKGGADVLIGGLGTDRLYGGGDAVLDRFDFNAIGETLVGSQRDRVYEFVSGTDRVDLQTIDANTIAGGNQAFLFSTTGAAAHSIWVIDSGNNLLVRGDVDGNTAQDFEILLMNVAAVDQADFML